MKIKMFRSTVLLAMSLALLVIFTRSAKAQVLFYDNFEQFGNGTLITNGYTYSPVSGPVGTLAEITKIAGTTVTMTNLAGSIRALYDCPASSASTYYNDYTATFAPQTNPVLQITWRIRIDSVIPGTLGGALAQLPITGNDESTVIAFGDGGQIFAVTNVLSSTNDLIPVGSWSNWVGSVISNQLVLNYPAHTITLSINGRLVATLPMRPDLTNYVDHVTFEFEEEAALGAVGNHFAIDDVKVTLAAPPQKSSFQWAKRIASNGSWPEGEPNIGLALDTNDNCYVTGWFDGTNDFGGVTLTNQSLGGSDILVAKYNSIGALQWVQRAGGTAVNYGRGIGLDTNGNVYVAGAYQGPANFGNTNLPATSGEEFFLAKYNSAGVVQWVQPSTGGSDDVYGIGLAVDGAGNSYALVEVDHLSSQATNITFGSTTVSIPANNGSPVMILVKYDDTGAVKWEQLIGGSGEVYATKVAVDATGNVYVRGTFFSTLTIGTSNLVVSAGSSRNMFVAKFDSSGGLKWIRHPVGGNVDEGGVAVDQAENIYVTGAFGGTPLNFGSITLTNVGTNIAHAFIAKYSSPGAILWARQAGGTNGGMVNGNVFSGFYLDVALDGKGNPYAAGLLSPNTTSPSNSGAAVVAKYNPTGTVSWADAASGPPANPAASVVAKCALDSNGNCYLAGWYHGTATFGTNVLQPQGYWNYFLAKVAPPASPTLGITLTNGLPQLSVTGDIGSLFSLQSSPNLAGTNTPWQTLATLNLTNRPQLYLDTSAPTGPNRFYRAGPPAL